MLTNNKLLYCLISIMFLSCSGLVENTRKSLLGKEKPRKKKETTAKWVSKEQYNELLKKYEDVNHKYESLKSQNLSPDQMNKSPKMNENTETVDVFGKDGIVHKETTVTTVSKETRGSVEGDLSFYKKAVGLFSNNKFEDALKIFQYLENSSNKQLSVRAVRYIGEIYLAKNQYDLSLQVFESIIKQQAFSATTLIALDKASICAGKLGLGDKKAQYESLLNDVFNSQG